MAERKNIQIAQHIRDEFFRLYRADEESCVRQIMAGARLPDDAQKRAAVRAGKWIEKIRAARKPLPGLGELLSRFGLSTQEGIALMCLAEALLRIPDAATADALIRDKMDDASWNSAFGKNTPWMVHATGWALALTGQITALDQRQHGDAGNMLGALTARMSQPVIREAMRAGMRWLAGHFVLGDNIESAIERAYADADECLRYSFDMLGEGARTMEDAERFLESYAGAIKAVGAANRAHPQAAPSGISVKLSALHPRYEMVQQDRVLKEMAPRLAHLAQLAAEENIFMVVDAEEADRLELSLNAIDAALAQTKLGDWKGFGVAVQAYQKRAPAVIDWLAELAALHKRPMSIRLIKGAYWDTEIKRAQERGWSDFPVFTRKVTTDVSYLSCARKLLTQGKWLAPVFGSHNALTIASLLEIVPDAQTIEFQRLQGMGDDLYELLHDEGYRSCVYAPVGDHEVLLGYLVRRLLENGANSSFVNRLSNPETSIADLIADPVEELEKVQRVRHPAVRLPMDLYAPDRRNSTGMDLADSRVIDTLQFDLSEAYKKSWQAGPIINGVMHTSVARPVYGPADHHHVIGNVADATQKDVDTAIRTARQGFDKWCRVPAGERARILERLANLIEQERTQFMAMMVREGGKTLNDALAEVREAADFCRYYAMRAREDFIPRELPGPTGEQNILQLHGRGVFICISPWNFPLAIFMGQIAAALVAGNSVIAKPAPQTPLIAAHAVKLAHQAGIPVDCLALLPGGGDIGGALVAHPTIAGVAFTGSVATGQKINRTLAARDGAIVPLIAETGGQNAMIVDTSALPEQVIDDVLTSSFRSAGQRCSALRVLYLPKPTADKTIAMLKGAMQELRIGDPGNLATDIGPVIDNDARARLQAHVARLQNEAKEIYTLPLPAGCANGTFFAPQAWKIPSITWMEGEVFGPVLHVVRYEPAKLDQMIAEINATGFGLTGGVHSRIEDTVQRVTQSLHAGNLYVNRSIIGAIVGVQPFGGEGLSGTGPKAGGPFYLPRFALERTISVNTTAAGGNASLLSEVGRG